jgi:putative membrane protein
MNRLKVLIILVTVALTLSGITSCEKSGVQAARESPLTAQKILSMDDKEFLMNAQQSEIRQKALAEAALTKSTNTDIREFANQVASERSRDLAGLKAVMEIKDFAQPPAAEEELQLEATNRLQRLSGSALDDEFISLITAEQQQSIGTFDRAAETAADPDVREYARGVLPALRKDFDAAVALQKRLGAHAR